VSPNPYYIPKYHKKHWDELPQVGVIDVIHEVLEYGRGIS
jgi:hypothetical protein